MPDRDPYQLLQLPRNAGKAQIEEAYNRLFDQYEPRAQNGDGDAISMLERLNEAHDMLIAPGAAASAPRVRPAGRPAGGQQAARPTPASRSATSATTAPGESIRVAPRTRGGAGQRPRSVQPAPSRSIWPMLAAGALVVLLIGAIGFYLLPKSPGVTPDPSRGTIAATVNGQPVYSSDYEARLATDKAVALNDPFFSVLANNFQGITGTRMLDVLSSDALDKVINLEVIKQQAQKEGLYPTADQQTGLIGQAKTSDLKPGQSFQDFLTEKHITEAQYNRTVIDNVVYSVMANQHMPVTGTSDARTDGFIKWICATRKNYDVKINMKFSVANDPCTSGLPSDVPLPGVTPQAPEPVATAPAQVVPGGTPVQAKP